MKIKKRYVAILCMAALCLTLIHPAEAQAFDKAAAKKKVTVTYKQVPSGILAVCRNKNSSDLKLTVTVRFKDSSGTDLLVSKQKNLCIGKKSAAAFFFQAPTDSNGNYISYSSYTASYSVAKSKYASSSKNIAVTYSMETVETQFTAINLSGKTLSSICATVVFYDADGDIADCRVKYLNCYEAGSKDQFSISYAGKSYHPAKTKVYINWAY